MIGIKRLVFEFMWCKLKRYNGQKSVRNYIFKEVLRGMKREEIVVKQHGKEFVSADQKVILEPVIVCPECFSSNIFASKTVTKATKKGAFRGKIDAVRDCYCQDCGCKFEYREHKKGPIRWRDFIIFCLLLVALIGLILLLLGLFLGSGIACSIGGFFFIAGLVIAGMMVDDKQF